MRKATLIIAAAGAIGVLAAAAPARADWHHGWHHHNWYHHAWREHAWHRQVWRWHHPWVRRYGYAPPGGYYYR
jgi:hypothetical protein